MKLQNGTVVKHHLDHIKGHQAYTNDIDELEDDFYSVNTYSRGTSVSVEEYQLLLSYTDLTTRGVHLNVTIVMTRLKVEEDVVTLTEH